MKRFTAIVVVALLSVGLPAHAATHQASVGNYYYEEDTQHDRTKIVVRQGDQVTFTVRAAAYPPHTVDVDALDIHSEDLLIGDSFTTPALNKPGNFYLYCRPHEVRGHHTRLIVLAAATPTPTRRPVASSTPAVVVRTTPAPTVAVTPSPTATLVPVGITHATGKPIRRDPTRVEALTGRRASNTAPWTRSLLWLLIVSALIVAAAAFALRRDAILRGAAVELAKAKPKPRKRSTQKRS